MCTGVFIFMVVNMKYTSTSLPLHSISESLRGQSYEKIVHILQCVNT